MLCIEPGRAAPPIPGMASLHAAMADSDSEGSEAETEGTEGTEEGAKHSVSNAPPAPAPVVQNTLVGVMQTYITDYLAVNRLNAPGATCGCAMPATGALSPTGAARAPASPRKGAWVLGEPRPAPPIES